MCLRAPRRNVVSKSLTSLGFGSEMSRLIPVLSASEFGFVLRCAASRAFSPHLERTRFHLTPHELDDFPRRETKLRLDRVKAGAIFPRHHNDSADIGIG